MIRKLRFRFALTVILSSFLILVVLIGSINIVNYRRVVSDSDLELDTFTRPTDMPLMPRPKSNIFTAVYDNDGTLIDKFTTWNSMYSDQNMEEYAGEVLNGNKDRGFIGDFRYAREKNTEGTLIVLVDCGPGLNNFRNFLRSSILLSLGCMIIVSAAAVIVSGRAVKSVAESYEKQRRFITDAGHEIRTPLAIINADADVILSDGKSQWAEDIKDQVERLTELTDSLISLSKMEEGLPEAAMERTDLSKIVDSSCSEFASMFLTGRKNLDKDIDAGLYVKGDSRSLKELMSILLDNALKYSPEGETTTVRLKQASKGIALDVSNKTSDQITQDDAKNLFERFYRADKSRNAHTGGYGIGLSVAQAIVNAHKGRISAEPAGSALTIKVIFPEG